MLNFRELSGQTDTHLHWVPAEQHQLQADTLTAYCRMRQDAQAAGITIAIASGFRSLQRQLSIWNRKWRGELTLRDKAGVPLDTKLLSAEQKLDYILHWSALPGASRHHWGTDFDFYDPTHFVNGQRELQLVPAEYSDARGPCNVLWRWLTEHAQHYGFFFPYARYQGGVAEEPWHLSYRPLAEQLQQQLTLEALQQLIESLEIEGQSTILKQLAPIYKNYINNVCKET